ncbi:AP2 domain-containing protein [Bacillus sp. TL12]|uniref:AP2 domain-containing protein n=1 Tax=Bacillus sp. TL12 TaxID=2894756 RepID=UPI001F51CBC9|nr:AP2 domain-containing protein [Bacillus sp. TL12]MCI0767436.1 hypothetical protein [Bacillus sp. TL12]
MRFNDISGKAFGKLTVIERADNQGRRVMWLCKCDCGNEVIVRSSHLTTGATISCGCARIKHGHSSAREASSEYSSWHNMITRCTYKKHESFKDYKDRGITVCDRWLSFDNFIADMGEKPFPNYSIERIDNDKGYYPENCIWADRKTQQRNQRVRHDNESGIRGVYFETRSGKYKAIIYMGKKRIQLGSFDNIEEAKQARLKAEQEYWNKSS